MDRRRRARPAGTPSKELRRLQRRYLTPKAAASHSQETKTPKPKPKARRKETTMAQQPTTRPAPNAEPPKPAYVPAPESQDPRDVRIRELEEALAKAGPHPNLGPAAVNPYAPTPPISVPADWTPDQEGPFAKERRLAAEKAAKEKAPADR